MEQIENNFKTGEITILVVEIFNCINLKGCGMSSGGTPIETLYGNVPPKWVGF